MLELIIPDFKAQCINCNIKFRNNTDAVAHWSSNMTHEVIETDEWKIYNNVRSKELSQWYISMLDDFFNKHPEFNGGD